MDQDIRKPAAGSVSKGGRRDRAAWPQAWTSHRRYRSGIEMNKDDPNTANRGQPELLVGREDSEKWMRDAGFPRLGAS